MAQKYLKINGISFEIQRGKKAELMVQDYRYAERRGDMHLWNVYGSFSYAKQSAFEDCDEVRKQVCGGTMYICSHNSMMFTLIYVIWTSGNKDKCYIVKETPTHRYICEVYKGALR